MFSQTESEEAAPRKARFNRARLQISGGVKYMKTQATQLSGMSPSPGPPMPAPSVRFDNEAPILKAQRKIKREVVSYWECFIVSFCRKMEGRGDEGLLALALATNRRGGIVRSGPSSHAIFFRAQANRLPPLALSTYSS